MSRLRALVTHDLGLKVVSLVIAIAIWAKVSLYGTDDLTQTYVRSIAIDNLDASLRVDVASGTPEARITLTGPRHAHTRLARRLRAFVDLRNVKSPLGEVTLGVETNVSAESEVRVRAEPARVRVRVLERPAPSGGP
jgi:YbbR domain-containing protein